MDMEVHPPTRGHRRIRSSDVPRASMTTTDGGTIRRVAGVDGCRAGWLVAFSEVDAKGAMAQPDLQVVPTFGAVFDMALDRIAVDIPIGLLDVLAAGGREA